MNITDQIKDIEARAKSAGVSMASLLAQADVNESTWWRWKLGKSSPLFSSMQRVTKAIEAVELERRAA
jgi:predicted transcriptional regulator